MVEKTEKEFHRTFVPSSADLGNWDQIEPLYKQLVEREIASLEDLNQWLMDKSELESCISEERTRRYVQMTCHTDDEEKEKAYLDFVEHIEPRCKPYSHKVCKKFFRCPTRLLLPEERFEVLNRNVEAEIKIYREENIPLQTEESKLSQSYQKLCGAMMVHFDGKDQTMPQMAKYLEETDRYRRREAWEKISQRRLQDREQMDEIFCQLVKLRNSIARNAGFDDFRRYAFLMFRRFDYSPKDCLKFHDVIERDVVPLAHRLAEKRRTTMGLDALRPWDLNVDPLGRPPLRPFDRVDKLMDGCEKIFRQIDPTLAERFVEMKNRGELDLDSRQGKAPGGYLTSFDEIRRPFIFMNAAGLQRDVETLLHESGHAFHMLQSRDEPIHDYRDAPLEFAEVASMSMELFGAGFLTEFYDEEETARAKRSLFEGIIMILPWIARIDAFQHWIYQNPRHVKEERSRYWLELEKRFGLKVDWSGFEAVRESYWQKQLHLFCYPFYYIEYGIAQIGALQLWSQYKKDPQAAIERYRKALALGGSRPLPQLFETAGAKFDFTKDTILPLMREIEHELAYLPE